MKEKIIKILRLRWGWFLAAALVIVITGGWFAYQAYRSSNSDTTAEQALQTAIAHRGNLVVSASAAGRVVPATEINIGFDESGTLAELLVKVGDRVQVGQVLARLQTNQSEEDIALAVAEAELNVLTAQQALNEITANSGITAAQALIDVESAEQSLADLKDNSLRLAQAAQALAEAEQAVKDAQSIYNGMRTTADQYTIDKAYAELVIAQARLRDQQEKFKPYLTKPETNLERAAAQLKLSAAQTAYDTALRYYNAVTGTGSPLNLQTSEADLAVVQAQLAQAQVDWEQAQLGATPGEIALAEATLSSARASYAVLKNGPDPAEIAKAEAELASAQAKLTVAREDRAVLELLAPQAGTITTISASIGEAVGSGALISLADLSQPLLEVYLDETDLDKIAVGYEADVVFDALPDMTYTGHIIQVNPSLETVSNVATVVALLQLDTDSFAKPQGLPIGANATVDVIGGRAENAVLIPVEALREIAPGDYAVFVMENGKPRLRVVTIGLMDYTSVEITSGLEAGETVTTGIVETVQSNNQ